LLGCSGLEFLAAPRKLISRQWKPHSARKL
jgi:hypothetical protein